MMNEWKLPWGGGCMCGQPWAATGAAHSFATQPDLQAYTPLVEAFVKKGKRLR